MKAASRVCNVHRLLKQVLLFILLLCCLISLHAQEKGNLKLALEAGILPVPSDNQNLAFFLNIEPKVKVLKNTFVGLRLGLTLNSNTFEYVDDLQFIIMDEDDHGVISFVPTIDYYLNDFDWKERNFRPYLGLGLGYHLMSYIDVVPAISSNPPRDRIEVGVKKRIGLLLRGGFELHKLRLGLEYSFIPKADIELPDGQAVGSVQNSYLGLSVGLVIGGGKFQDTSK